MASSSKIQPWSAKRAKLETKAEHNETESEDECDPHDVDDHEKKDDEKILPHIQAFHESIQKDFEDMVSEILTFQRTEEQYEAPEPFGDGDNHWEQLWKRGIDKRQRSKQVS